MTDLAEPSLVFLMARATQLASEACFDEFLVCCQTIFQTYGGDPEALLPLAHLLSSFGFLSAARTCLERCRECAPDDFRPVANLANLAREAGDHVTSRRAYDALLLQLPNHPVVRRNALVSLEYDPDVVNQDRLAYAKKWGQWATAQAGGYRNRPSLRPLTNRSLRVGYVSADFCQHTVGLFIKHVLAAHNPEHVTVVAYSAGRNDDWVTSAIRAVCQFQEVAPLDDAALAALIRHDQIDVLVDLSGHTAGSRLSVFAHRPAPVQVSWLGYFATTGLAIVDAVLLDEWHAPQDMQNQFVEPIVRLPNGRFCYAPLPFAPADMAPLPYLASKYITFGCFNNTAKLNAGVYAVWSTILLALPNSRLVLKWRTLQDPVFCQSIHAIFNSLGVPSHRIELRGASFHVDLLKQYADIDIALDPFPFTGGLTSCEALWMGVPVITWPQGRVVSRQTFALLSVIGLPELSGECASDYVRIAVELGQDIERLREIRTGLRTRMQSSHLCDVAGFTRDLEATLLTLATTVENANERY